MSFRFTFGHVSIDGPPYWRRVLTAFLLLVTMPEQIQAGVGLDKTGPVALPRTEQAGGLGAALLVGLVAGGLLGFFGARRYAPCHRPQARSQERLYRGLVEYSADPVYIMDMGERFRMVFANDACCAHYGLSRPELYQLCLPDWDPNFTGQDLDALREKIRHTKFYTVETQHRLSDGRIVPVEVSGNYLWHEGRELVAGYFRDISERKRWEAALKESAANLQASEEHLRYVLDSLGSCVYIKDQHYRYQFANKLVRGLFQADEDAIKGATDADFFDAATVEQLQAVDRRVLEGGETVTAEESNSFLSDGTVSTYISVKMPLRRPDGTIHGLLGISTDISERKRMETALRESEARFRAMADAAPVLIWVADADKRCVWFNQIWLSFTGRSLAEEYGDGWLEGVHPEDLARCVAIYTTGFDSRRPFRMEYRLRRHDGQYRWILDSGQPRFEADGTFHGYIGSCIDITDHKEAEASLARSRRELAAVVGAMDDIVLEVDADLRFRQCWASGAEKLFLPHPMFIGKRIGEVFDAGFAAPFIEAISDVLNGGAPRQIDYPSPIPQDARWFNARISRLETEHGSATGAVLVIRDVTERWRMENEARRRERYLRAVIDNFPFLVWLKDEESRFLAANEPFVRACGQDSVESIVGKTDLDVWPRDLAELYRAEDFSVLRSGVGKSVEEPIQQGDQRGWLETYKSPVILDGQVLGTVGYARDITDRKRMETALRISEQLLDERNRELDAIFNLSPDGFVAFDGGQRLKYASPAFMRLAGIDLRYEHLIGLDAEGFGQLLCAHCEPKAGEALRAWLRQQFEPDSGADVPEVLLLELNSPRRGLEARGRRNETDSVSVVLYFHDITERLEVDHMKSDFLSTAAHELRTPLASIYGFAELLLGADDYEESARQEMLQIIFRQSKLISSLVNELLDLARIEARQGKDFVFESVDLSALTRETVMANAEASQRRDAVRVELPEQATWVRADLNKLRQALGNVLSNACKYSPSGGEISLSLRQVPGKIGIEVRDHGIGMTPEQTRRICERFYRADHSGSIPGTGLGMSIVKEIVTLHGGRLEIDSEFGMGTAVTLWLPDEPQSQR